MMVGLYNRRLILRLLTLGVLILCLSLLSRNGSDTPLAGTNEPPQLLAQLPVPNLSVQQQTDSPLTISAPRILSWDGLSGEYAFELINMASKPIRAFAIKEVIKAGNSKISSVSFSNLDLGNRPPFQPNQSITNYDTCHATSEKEQHITLSVDYVEFSDGTKWGEDTGKSAERSSGQRAAVILLSKRLLQKLNESGPNDLMGSIDAEAANVAPPEGHSDEWKAGFRNGIVSIVARLKNAQKIEGSNQVEQKLRQLSEKFKGAN